MDGKPITVRLIALTDEARRVLRGEYITLDRFPFKIGREGRTTITRMANSIERRLGSVPQLDDLYIEESPLGQFYHVSREHLVIDRDAQRGTFVMTDRGSVCGTIVGAVTIGGDRAGGRVELCNDDVVVVGTLASPFVFKFHVG